MHLNARTCGMKRRRGNLVYTLERLASDLSNAQYSPVPLAMYSMIFGLRKPEPVRRTTFVGFMAVQGHVLLRKIDPFTQNRPYLSSIPLLWLGVKPLYFCTKKVLPPLWGGFFKAIGFSEPPSM
ncbi:uncharacterized protein STEHIDRAFT_120029 [Stereum hirsutum FP-91666 SS1]|uniref:uncharacterized protein n=1 Tax=Stereum hirsutum (strain FP-91666) TaxID=721885 RepID=UPI000440BDF3|nr:uncharacterized protein STEHIDRAFT_120029 [Stereum hirsutum FP-91666 SS1]EIM89395.1 hypothetical protein STEHIDRAFT_120029 [Stereum hirsutum FP-91666 SS1]